MKTIRWGMIGCGDVAEVKSGPGFYKAPGSSLVVAMRRNRELAADFARRHGVARATDDADEVIRAPDVDAIYVATLTDTHCDYVLRCAAAGKPVYVEKPMAMTHAQALDMVKGCQAAGVPLWVAYYRRALPRFLKVKALIEEGAVGRVLAVSSRQLARPALPGRGAPVPWRIVPEKSGGGYFFEAACHTFDILDFLFGPIEVVHGVAANQAGDYAAEDMVTAAYSFASGVQGVGLWCYNADVDEEMNEVVGDRGRIQFSTTAATPIRIFRGEQVEALPVGDPPHVQQPLIESIVAELNGVGACLSTGVSAARTAWVMDEILAAHRARART